MSDWKPGDVAIVDGPGTRRPITFFENENTSELMFTNGHGFQHPARHIAGKARPLVVIDPEDREQVERLGSSLYGAGFTATTRMADALREFADPKPPKPDEPLGLGAVVEDSNGDTWVRMSPRIADFNWFHAEDHTRSRAFRNIAATRVLSDGVQS